jgi:hypothetical protein
VVRINAVVQLHVFMFLVPLRFPRKTMFCRDCAFFMFLCLFTHTGVQYLSISNDVRVVNNNTTGAIIGADTAHSSGTPEFTNSFLYGSCCSIFNFMCSIL